MNIMNHTNKLLYTALVLSVLGIWGVAQTNQTEYERAMQKVLAEYLKTSGIGISAQSLTNSQLPSSAGPSLTPITASPSLKAPALQSLKARNPKAAGLLPTTRLKA
jgi:hypothetical protein